MSTGGTLHPEPLRSGPSQDRIVVGGIELKWDTRAGTCEFQGLPMAMMWVDSTLAGLMSGLATMVGPERFSLALQSEGRKSVESDWLLIEGYPDFARGFAAIAVVAGVAGWGEWQLVSENLERRECTFRALNSWEGRYQRTLGACWGSAMVAGKFAGYCSKRFGTNCWATQTAFIARGDPCDEFTVAPSSLNLEDEIERLLSADQATRADMAVALSRLREAREKMLVSQEQLEQQVGQRTRELASSLAELQLVNERLERKVGEHALAREALRENEERMRKLIELAPMSMAIVGTDGRIEYINQRAIDTFGYTPADIPDMEAWWVLAYPDPDYRASTIERWMGYVATALRTGREIERDTYRVVCKDGALKTVVVFGVPVTDKILVMFDDVTRQTMEEDLLRQSNAALELRVQERVAELAERNRMLEITTAQLRKLGAKLVRVEENERKRMSHILHDQLQQMLVSAVFRLSALEGGLTDRAQIKTLRDASKAIDDAIQESRSLVLDLSPPILREGLGPALRWLQARTEEQYGLRVNLAVGELPPSIGEDLRVALFHATRELLLNVVKHAGVTAAGLTITCLPDSRLQVVVSDKGRGYTPAAPADAPADDIGFGLMAVRERIESIGGSMDVQSAPGAGCRVALTVPFSAAAAPGGLVDDPSARSRRRQGGDSEVLMGARIRILLADDHTILRQGLRTRLTRDPDIEVVGEAADGEAAVELARALRPEVILMDITMPKQDGIEATRAIRAEFPGIKVIGLTMHAERHWEEAMKQAGAISVIVKTDAAEVLLATIHACCGR